MSKERELETYNPRISQQRARRLLYRGKLRDKRLDSKKERIKREQLERRRPPKRESRISTMHIHSLEEDYLFDEEDAQLVTTVVENK